MQPSTHPLGSLASRGAAGDLRLACLVGLIAITGCTHHRNMAACTPAPGESECWRSSRRDASGRVRHVVVERVTPRPRCDEVRIEKSSYDERGVLVQRVVEDQRCRVVDHRTVDRYDLAEGELERAIWIDTDHDDRFDRFEAHTVRMSESQRAFALEKADETERDAAPKQGDEPGRRAEDR